MVSTRGVGDAFLSDGRAPHHRVDAQDHLAHAERLGHIVVGAQLEPDDAIGLGAARGQHQDRDLRGLRVTLEQAAHVGARDVRQIEIQDHQRRLDAARAGERLGTGRRVRGLIARAAQIEVEQRAQVALVVDNQDRASTLGHVATKLHRANVSSVTSW
jgi:hypothetical protein